MSSHLPSSRSLTKNSSFKSPHKPFCLCKGDIASKIKGLKDGAEDYIVKPFEMLEVMVRLEKVLERNGTVQEQIQIGCYH